MMHGKMSVKCRTFYMKTQVCPLLLPATNVEQQETEHFFCHGNSGRNRHNITLCIHL